MDRLIGDGNLASALTDLRDIGKYVARILVDPRTLNKLVFVYNEVWTQEKIVSLFEKLSGDTIPRAYTAGEEIESAVEEARARYHDDRSVPNLLRLAVAQYPHSIWLRGDNLPQSASYLGYLDGKDLYPDLEYTPFVNYVEEVLAGKAKGTYENRVLSFDSK